jgi:hypothetical protein
MKVRNIGSNMTELVIGHTRIMFSYSTPVAGQDDEGLFRTAQRYSSTTSRHINKYLGKDVGRVVPQAYIDSLVGG